MRDRGERFRNKRPAQMEVSDAVARQLAQESQMHGLATSLNRIARCAGYCHATQLDPWWGFLARIEAPHRCDDLYVQAHLCPARYQHITPCQHGGLSLRPGPVQRANRQVSGEPQARHHQSPSPQQAGPSHRVSLPAAALSRRRAAMKASGERAAMPGTARAGWWYKGG